MAKQKPETPLRALEAVSDGGAPFIQHTAPYTVRVAIVGVKPLLFHSWNIEGIEEKARAAKGSKAKKSDDIESYVYRDAHGHLALPGENLRQSIIHAAKYAQDPRSPRKSAMDLFKAGVAVEPEYASLGVKSWDFVDQRRVGVQRQGITRRRPALNAGWRAEFEITVILAEYVARDVLLFTLVNAGRLIGVCDFRPTYGRFQVVSFD